MIRSTKLSVTLIFLITGFATLCVADSNSGKIVKNGDEAIRIAISACGHSLNIPASDHPRWKAELSGDHWEAWMLSDRAQTKKCALQEVTIPRLGGRVTYCTVNTGCSGS